MVHALVDYLQLKGLCQELRRKAGNSFNNLSNMLGGGQKGKEGKIQDAAQDSSILGAVLDFVQQRFRGATPRSAAEKNTRHLCHRKP